MIEYQSDIPKEAKEKLVSKYRSGSRCIDGRCSMTIRLERREYWLDGRLRGVRSFTKEGKLFLEYPYWQGKRHGTSYRWHDNGVLDYIESHHHGVIHGKTYQYADSGELMGTSEFVNGTGYAVWWDEYHELDQPGYYLAEVYFMKDNLMEGYEWWINEDQNSLFIEKHYWKGNCHGIERHWNDDGMFFENYPKYYIMGKEVDQFAYIKASEEDPRLPKFKASDQSFVRVFPEEIRRIMRGAIIK